MTRTVVEIVLKTVDRASKGLTSFLGRSIRGLASLNGAIAGLTFGLVTKKLFEVGTNAEEMGSKFRTVFGDMADDLDVVATKWGRLAGLTRTAARDILGTIGQVGQSLGMSQRQSAAFAEQVIRTSGDIASFQNKRVEDVAHALISAFNGEREALKLLAVGFNEAELTAEALNQTRKRSIEEVTREEKALASLALIQRKAGVQMGDLARTQDSLANKWRRARADLGNVLETIVDLHRGRAHVASPVWGADLDEGRGDVDCDHWCLPRSGRLSNMTETIMLPSTPHVNRNVSDGFS